MFRHLRPYGEEQGVSVADQPSDAELALAPALCATERVERTATEVAYAPRVLRPDGVFVAVTNGESHLADLRWGLVDGHW